MAKAPAQPITDDSIAVRQLSHYQFSWVAGTAGQDGTWTLQLVLDQGAWEEVLTISADDADNLQDILSTGSDRLLRRQAADAAVRDHGRRTPLSLDESARSHGGTLRLAGTVTHTTATEAGCGAVPTCPKPAEADRWQAGRRTLMPHGVRSETAPSCRGARARHSRSAADNRLRASSTSRPRMRPSRSTSRFTIHRSEPSPTGTRPGHPNSLDVWDEVM